MDLMDELDQEISEYVLDPVQLEQLVEEEEEMVVRGRGRPKQPELWTRVLSITHDDPFQIRVHELKADLLLAQAYRRVARPGWRMLFHPKTYAQAHPEMELELFSLSE